MARKVASFILLPPLLSVPTLPPSTPLQCRTNTTPHLLSTHINTHTHSLPCPAPWGAQAGVGVEAGFPDYLNRFRQMVRELSSRGHVALSPNSLNASSFLSPFLPKRHLFRSRVSSPENPLKPLQPLLPKHQPCVHPSSFSPDPETFCPPLWDQTSSSLTQWGRRSRSCPPTF